MNATTWHLRPAEPADDRFLERLYLEVHAGDFAGVALPEEQIRGLLLMQARAQRLGYLREFPTANSRLIVAGSEAMGRLLVNYGVDTMHLIDVALLPSWQRRGIGTKLLEGLQKEAKARTLPLRLSVRPGNPALLLYTRMGFKVIAGGLQMEMEWTPQITSAPPAQHSRAESPAEQSTSATEEQQGLELPRLVGRRFRFGHGSAEVTLDRMERLPAAGGDSFSLVFLGESEPMLPQATYTLLLLDAQGQPEREFAIFLVPIGPAGGKMQYEAVFNW